MASRAGESPPPRARGLLSAIVASRLRCFSTTERVSNVLFVLLHLSLLLVFVVPVSRCAIALAFGGYALGCGP